MGGFRVDKRTLDIGKRNLILTNGFTFERKILQGLIFNSCFWKTRSRLSHPAQRILQNKETKRSQILGISIGIKIMHSYNLKYIQKREDPHSLCFIPCLPHGNMNVKPPIARQPWESQWNSSITTHHRATCFPRPHIARTLKIQKGQSTYFLRSNHSRQHKSCKCTVFKFGSLFPGSQVPITFLTQWYRDSLSGLCP